MKVLLVTSFIFLLCATSVAQWLPTNKSDRGIYLGFVSMGSRIKKDTIPTVPLISSWNAIAWKGEKVHSKLLFQSNRPIQKVTVHCEALINQHGNRIPAKYISASFLEYVITDGLNAKGSGCGVIKGVDSSLVEDIVSKRKIISIRANNSRPVWLSIAVPRNTQPGIYKGFVKVKNNSGVIGKMQFTINVINRILPEPGKWKFHLDLWQNPFAVARVHNVKLWSPQHLTVMRPYMQMLADAGQKTITASIIHDPWNSQTYDIYQSMIKWIKKKDGRWQYDYSIFDRWVSYMMGNGINKIINCYSMIPWHMKFYYYDEVMAKDTFLVAQPGSTEFAAHWKPMLTDFAKHLKQKGWFSKTAIAMDERPMEAMQKAIAVIKAADKDFKISLAGKYHPEIEREIFDYSVASNQVIDSPALAMRKQLRFSTTFYTSCSEGYPNTFTFSPTAEAAWMGWFAANKGYDGYLRWAYNCWPEHPLQDSRFRRFAAGDTYFIYPGYQSSVRFERLIEGIQDYEKIRILKEEFTSKKQSEKRAQLEEVLKKFEISRLKTENAADMLDDAKSILNSF